MIKTILKFSVSSVVNLILGLLSAVILTRVFSPDTYGTINIFNSTVATGLSVLCLGLDSSFIRFYNEPPGGKTNKDLGTNLLLICLSITLLAGLCFTLFFYKGFTGFIFGFESRIVCIMVFLSIFAQIIIRFLNIKYRMDFNTRAFTIQSILTQASLRFFVIIAALFSLSISGVISFNTVGVLSLSIIYLFIQRKNFFSFAHVFDFSSYKPVFLFALFSAPLTICINFNTSMTQQLIAHMMDVSKVGIYSSAGYFASILSALQGGFSTFWSAYMYSNYADKQVEIKKVNEYLLFAIILVFGGLILCKDIIYLLIGQQFQESKQFFSLLLSYPIFILASETTTYGIGIKKKTHLSLICFMISIAINLGLVYLLIPVMGLKGAALASLISGLLLYVMRSWVGQRLYQSISNLKLTILYVTFIAVMALLPAFTNNVITVIGVLLIIIVCLVINRKEAILCINKIKDEIDQLAQRRRTKKKDNA